ncbi:mechanosensitive ion channel family protein [Gracilimonas mengyeensis]|uniref:Small-conductance mechanosensitive channel n=1 Tax=Gracilimonas mengyeensis TaxID=1302730 RepID=A0A521BCW5_9BACT|nr:mechanosensitive ion channel domain-containing protein [Gracilimonas mengyeensis]SMO44926.1 Small-conductance mechanosensitive channel [Gracilimonas mengyeensis]
MKAIQYLLVILFSSLMLLTPARSGFGQSQVQDTVVVDTASGQSFSQPDSLYSRLDSTLDQRFQRVDSLLKALEGKGGEVADSVAAEGEETLAQLEEIISWQKIVFIILFFIAVYYLSRFITILLDNFSEKVSKYRLRIKRMVPVMRVIIWVVAIYVAIAGIVQPPYATVITVLASVGIAVGLAAQDMLKNLFGGIMLILDRPFQVGDKIQFEDHYGEVQQIGLRSSRIVTPGDSVVTIPNGELIRTAVSNANTGALDCLVVTEIFLPANAPVEEVKEVAYKAVVSSRFVFLAKPVSIMTQNEMHERRFILKLKVKAYVLDIRYEFPFQSDVTELILTELSRRGIIKDEALSSGKPAETE